jgi:hypothetical protein
MRAIPCTVQAVTPEFRGRISRATAPFHRAPGLPICERAPELPSTANNRHQQQPADMKLAQALNLAANAL